MFLNVLSIFTSIHTLNLKIISYSKLYLAGTKSMGLGRSVHFYAWGTLQGCCLIDVLLTLPPKHIAPIGWSTLHLEMVSFPPPPRDHNHDWNLICVSVFVCFYINSRSSICAQWNKCQSVCSRRKGHGSRQHLYRREITTQRGELTSIH